VEVAPLASESVMLNLAAPTPLNGHSGNAKESTHVVHGAVGSKHHSAATSQVLDRMLVMLDGKVQVQVKDELSGGPKLFDKMTGRIRNDNMLHQSVKWVSLLCIARRPMRWVLRSKF
jgi:hypothetical protein